MSDKDIPGAKLITCVLYHGGGLEVQKHLHKNGINRTALYHARGSAIGDPVDRKGLPPSFEKEILLIAVNEKEADGIFDMIFDIARIDRPHGAFIYMEKLKRITGYSLEGFADAAAGAKMK
jgi:hypothetical protein